MNTVLTYYSRMLDGLQKVLKVLEIILLAAITLIMAVSYTHLTLPTNREV